MHVALVGPCSPVDVAGLMDVPEAVRALEVPGYRGIPVSELAKGLVSAGHQVTVVSTDSSIGDPSVNFSGPQFRMVVQRSRARPRRYLLDMYGIERKGIAGILQDSSPDIVHVHWTYEFELAAQDSGLIHVTTAHDAPITILRQMRDPYRAARLAVAARARPGIRHLSAVGPYLATRWRKEMLYGRPIQVIPNSVPTDVVPGRRNPAPGPVLLEVADAGRLKNVRGLLHAFKIVRAQIQDAELRLVGPGLGVNDSLAVRARSDGLAGGVSFLGRLGRDELSREYGRAWVFVHASLEESFGLVLIEALAAGLPVIGGRDSGGVADVLEYGRAGTLTDVSKPHALARTIIEELTRGPEARPSLFGTERFSPLTVATQYLDWYSRCVSSGGRGEG